MDRDKTGGIPDHEWENRILCSDESCIGVIGPDGRCKECGLPYDGELPGSFSEAAVSGEGRGKDETRSDGTGTDEKIDQDEASIDDDEWARRKLCVDESCIGVIGPDGRCKDCGKPG